MQFNFNFEAFEKSGKDKNEAINYLKGLNSSLDFDKLENDLKGDTEAIYNTLRGGNFSFSKPSVEETREKLLKNKENEALRAEFNTALSWLDNKQNYNFYDFKKAKERANSKEGLIKQDLEAKEKELKRKEALLEKRLENENIFTKSLRDTADNLGLNAAADVLEMGLNKLGFKDENYIFESEKEDIKNRALKSVREKLERGDLELNEREKHALRSKYDELDYKKALEKEKEKLRLIQKDRDYNKSEVEFMEEELGFFHTLFNDDKDTVREFKDAYKSEGIISADVQKAVNVLKQFEESELLRHAFSDKKQELQQEYLKNALVIAELNGFDDVGLSRENELYFIKKDKDKEEKYLVNTGFLDNFWDLIENSKFEIAGGIAGGIKGFNSGKSAKGKVVKSVLGAAAGSFGGGLMDAKIADMYLNRESDYGRNLEYALQAGLLSLAGDGVIIAAKPMVKGAIKGAKGVYTYAKTHTPLGLFSTIPSQNISAANKIIDEVFTPEMKEELKQAQKEFGGGVKAENLANPIFEKLKQSFAKKYGQEDKKTKSVEKLAEIFNQNSLKTKQQEMLDLIRSDKDGSTLAYLLEVAKDDVKIQNNLKNMLNLASSNVEKNLKNLNINPREIKSILDEFEAGNKAAFKEVENQIAKLYNEDIKVVLDRNAYENIKKDFLENGVNLEEMTPFLRDLENNVFSKEGVSFAKLNNFRKNLNFYIFNKDKTPGFINTLKKITETSLKAEIDKGIDNIFKELPKAYESIKELYSTSLKDYAAMKELNESIKNLKLQDSAKSADEVVDSLIKYAKGQGEGGENNLQKIKAYLGEENNAFLEMQILNRLFKESMVENDRAKVRVFDSESFLNRVKELVGENPVKYALNKDEAKLFLENLNGAKIPEKLNIEDFLKELESVENKENFISHLSKKEDAKSRLAYLNLVKPTLEEADLILHNGKRQDYIKKFRDEKGFYTLLITEENGKRLITFLPKTREDFIRNKIDNASLIQSFTSRASKQGNGLAKESITQPLFKSKEAGEFLELVEGFDKLYKNDAIIAKNLTQGTASKLSTSIATSAEGAIKQKVVKGAFDPIFRLLPDGVLFGLFSKQIQGGALRYHLRKALSRSLNYDDFKLKLERELKRTHFNSNTSRLIDEFMDNLDKFNAEKEAKLARIREEEELKRAQESPLKEDFGVNFEGFKGKEAVLKLLEEKRGQVKGAFYKEGLGEIDLVWGDDSFGLKHILNKHGGEFENLARELSEAVENGKIVKDDKGRLRLEYENKIVGIKDNWKGEKTAHWVVTAYVKKEKEASLYASTSFTKGETLPLNSKESIAQKNALSLNDEPLEVEVIEEASLNEPMKFLEFQQRKLLTYIKQNTPLRLLERKIELKTRDILNFLEQSALNGKEKAFLMRHLERDLDKIEAKIKEKESETNEALKSKREKFLTQELIDYLREVKRGLLKVSNLPLEKLKDEVMSIDPKFIKKEAEYKKRTAREFYDNFENIGINDLMPAINLSNVDKSGLSYEKIKQMQKAIKNRGEFKRFFSKEKKANFEYETQEAKQKAINKVDTYAKSEAFKALNKDKQEAILSLKSIKPSIMPDELSKDNLENILKHFNSKQDKAQREFYAKLFNDTKKNPHIVLEVKRENELRQEYIKAYQHKDTHDLYYIAITKDKDTINVTGYPITKIKDVINQIKNAEKVVWRQQGDQAHTALVSKETQNLESADESIAQNAKRNFTRREKKLNKVLNLSENEDKIIKDGFVETYGETSFGEKLLRQGIEENKLYVKKLLTQLKELESIDKQSKLYALKLKEMDKNIEDYWDNFVGKKLLYSFRETQNYADYGEKVKELRKWGQEKFESLQNAFKEQIREPFEVLKRENANLSKNVESESEVLNKAQKAWLEAFGLKSIEEAYTPKFSKEVNEALERVLNGEQIKLTKGSYEKLLKRDREEFLPFIKETLENADAVLKDKENALIFVKDIGKKSYFTSVAKNANNEWVISTNSLKTLNTLKNRLDDNGELLYLSKEASNILAEAFTKRAFSNELASESIPQKPQQKALNLQEIEQALKARISQINDEIITIDRAFEDKAFREKLKEASKVKPILEALKKEWKALEPVIVTWTHTDYSKFKPKKYYNRKPNLSNLWHIEETLDVYKGYARENERQAKQVEREIALLEKYVKLLKDKEAEVKKLETDKKALLTESYIIPVYNKLREAFKNGQHTTEQILEAKNIDIKRDSFIAKGIINEIAQLRQYLEQFFNITPLKEFGINYAEFYKDGKGAIQKLIAEKGGQVSGAFYKEGLGEIDLVWGDENFGLKHILEQRAKQWGEEKALKFISHLSENIEKGQIVELEKGRVGIKTDLTTIILDKKENNNFVLTAFRDRNNKKELESLNLSQSKTFTSENAETNAKESPVTPLNQDSIARRRTDLPSSQSEAEKTTSANANEIIPQRSINLAMEKFHYDEKKAKDLLEWHKDSSPLTKDENGLPRVFYHGSGVRFQVFKKEFDEIKTGFWFADRKIKVEEFAKDKRGKAIYPVFLKMKNPIWLTYQKEGDKWVFDWLDEEGKTLLKEAKNQGLSIDYFQKDFKFKEFLQSKGYDGIVLKTKINGNLKHSVFDSNQIKHIDNKGSYTDTSGKISKDKPKDSEAEHKYFNEKSENIYYSNPHLGAGLVGGVLNGLETDEDGNITGFDPAKFAMGFLGGSLGSKAVSKGIKWRANKVKKAYPNIAKDNPALMEQIAKRDLLTYAKNESANALTRFLNKNKLFDSTRGLFAGEKALLNEAYAPHKARLKEAKALEISGADEIEIWEKTGWYKDKDDKWKFEISQRGGEFKWDLLKKVGKDMLSEDRSMRLEEVLQDDALFRAYPQLKELKIRAVEIDDSVLGQYSEVKKNIMLSPDLNSMRAKRTLYHEIQHAIQDIEGFAYGDKWELRKNYKLRHGEVEARNVENRLLTRKNDLKKLDKEIQKLTKEIQNEESAELGDYEKFSLALKKKDLVDMLEFKDKILSLDDEIIKKHPYQTMDTPLSETIADTTIQGEALSKANPSNLSALRNETKELLKPFTHKAIKNRNDNTKAIVTMSGVKEMLSVKAIKQSVKNGFKAKQHIKAVKALPALFEKAIFKERQKQRHFKDYVEAYRVYSADFEGGKAIISVQERKVGNDVLYFLKLDELRLNNA